MDASIEDAILYTKPESHELDMIFSMEHMEADYKDGDRWTVQTTDFLKLKRTLSKWQTKMDEEGGWNSLFWSNHDQPRVVSRFGDEGRYRLESAKMLAAVLHMMKGTPYIYQGEEFGMPNPGYETIEEYQDIESLNIYQERMAEGIPEKTIMQGIIRQSRDNARSPMQWNSSKGGGFSKAKPWINMGKSWSSINAQADLENSDGVFRFYQKLIELRKTEELISSGTYRILEENHPSVWSYLREGERKALLVIGNFYGEKTEFTLPEEFLDQYEISELLLSNYKESDIPEKNVKLREYEVGIYRCAAK